MSDSGLRVGIVGAGNAGQAIAADLVHRGRTVVAIYDKFPEPVAAIRERGGVELVGPVVSGFAPVRAVNRIDDLEEADVLIVTVPATAHRLVAQDLAPRVRADQTVILCPGYVGGTLIFRQEFLRVQPSRLPFLVETATMPFASRLVGPAQVGIKGIKKMIHIAALSVGAPEVSGERLQGLFRPQLVPAQNVLEVGFNNPNPMTHVPLTIMNWGHIEGREFQSHFDYHEWITPGIERVSDRLDSERVAVMQALGLRPFSHQEFQAASYEGKWQIVEAKTELSPSSWTIPPRFVDEDVPCGLVPISSLGRQLEVPTPITDALIHLSSLMRGRDFWREGRTSEALGLQGLSRAEILDLVTRGTSAPRAPRGSAA